MPAPRARLAVLALAAAGLAALALAGAASAHNPALTVYEPVRVDDALVTAGEEGRLVGLSLDGEVRWTDQRSLHVTGPPVAAEGVAAVPARTVDASKPVLIGLDAEGVVFETPLEARGLAFPAPAEDGFRVATEGGQLLDVAPDGTVRGTVEGPFGARTPMVPAPGGGWVLAGEDRRVAIVDADGQLHRETRVSGRPGDLAVDGDTVLVAFHGEPRGHGALQAYHANLTTQWVHDLDGLRVGGEIALAEAGPVVGTFNPDGARLVALDRAGEVRWTRSIDEDTAAAARAHEGTVLAATNSRLVAVDAGDGEPLWNASAEPRVVSPRVAGDLALVSGANDTLSAHALADGEPRWTYTDGVREVPWSEHGLGADEGADAPDGTEREQAPAPGPGALAAAGVLLAALAARRRA